MVGRSLLGGVVGRSLLDGVVGRSLLGGVVGRSLLGGVVRRDTSRMESKGHVIQGHELRVTRKGPALVKRDWLTGPNKDYGFSLGGTSATFVREEQPIPTPLPEDPEWLIRRHIEAFLDRIDPETGYIRD